MSEDVLQKSGKVFSQKLEQTTAKKEVQEAFEKAETKLEDNIPKENKIEEVKITNKKGLTDYEKAGLLSRTSKVYQGLKYEVLVYSDKISWKVLNDKFVWDNHTRLWGGELEFDFNTYGVKGLGQQWTKETFEIFGNRIKTVKAEWKQLPDYPGGESLGYKQFNKVFDKTYDFEEAVKSTRFYETMNKRGYQKIDGYETEESVIVILKK